MDQLITGTGNVEEIGVFICKMRETLFNCRSIQKINSLEDRRSSSLFTICLFVCLIIVDNTCEKASSFHSDGSIFLLLLLLLLLLCYERVGSWTSCPNLKILF